MQRPLLYPIFAFAFTLFNACTSDKSDPNIDMLNVMNTSCPEVLSFITAADSLPSFDLDFSKDYKELFQAIEKQINDSICYRPKFFQTHFDIVNEKFQSSETAISLPLMVEGKCATDPIICGLNSSFTILINQNNDILLEDEFDTIDEINHRLRLYYKNIHEMISPKHASIRFRWDTACSQDSIGKIFGQVIKGYTMSVQDHCLRSKKKKLCELTPEELDEILTAIPFRFLVIEEQPFIPPPPPPLEEIE